MDTLIYSESKIKADIKGEVEIGVAFVLESHSTFSLVNYSTNKEKESRGFPDNSSSQNVVLQLSTSVTPRNLLEK